MFVWYYWFWILVCCVFGVYSVYLVLGIIVIYNEYVCLTGIIYSCDLNYWCIIYWNCMCIGIF